jgi:hypothetical protein
MESEVELVLAVALGVGRRRAVPLVGESPGVERRGLDWGREAREEALAARSVEVDAERELLDPLGYGEGRESERDAWVGLLVETGVSGRSSPSGRDMLRCGAGDPCVLACVETARLLASFDAMRGCRSVGVMPGIFCVCSGRAREMSNGWANGEVREQYGNEG